MNLRKPTKAEKNELVEYLVTTEMENDLENAQGYVENAAIAVFDNYITGSPGYSGKLMVVVYDGGPYQTETYIWERKTGLTTNKKRNFIVL